MYEIFPAEVKTFSVRGLMFPNEKEFSSAPVHGAVGSEGYSSLLGTASLRDSRFVLFFGGSPPRSGFLVMAGFVMFLPPRRPP